MTNVVTASRENVDWAIGVIDQALAGEEIDAHDAFKAGAVLSVVSIAAFDLAEEVKRLQAQSRALVAAVRPVIEQADLDAATRPKGGLANYYGFYEVVLTNNQVEALRMAMEDSR